jgi:OOP family OmpA-OmpF porin
LDLGGDMLVEYKLGKHTQIGLYSGITYVSGKHFDGVPEYRHKNNFICETGVRIGWTICTKRKEQNKPLDSEVAKKDSEVVVDSAVLAEFEQLVTLEKKNVPQDKQSNNNQQICFPTIYFSFNRVDIKSSENDKLLEMKDLLEQHPEIMVNITGWCDTRGSEEVNMRISHQRAETVRRWLIRNGISPSRIRIKGGGTDRTEKKASKARRTQTQERKEKDE